MQRDYRPFLDAGSFASKTELALQLYAENSPLVPITIPYEKVFSSHHMQDLCTFSGAPLSLLPKMAYTREKSSES